MLERSSKGPSIGNRTLDAVAPDQLIKFLHINSSVHSLMECFSYMYCKYVSHSVYYSISKMGYFFECWCYYFLPWPFKFKRTAMFWDVLQLGDGIFIYNWTLLLTSPPVWSGSWSLWCSSFTIDSPVILSLCRITGFMLIIDVFICLWASERRGVNKKNAQNHVHILFFLFFLNGRLSQNMKKTNNNKNKTKQVNHLFGIGQLDKILTRRRGNTRSTLCQKQGPFLLFNSAATRNLVWMIHASENRRSLKASLKASPARAEASSCISGAGLASSWLDSAGRTPLPRCRRPSPEPGPPPASPDCEGQRSASPHLCERWMVSVQTRAPRCKTPWAFSGFIFLERWNCALKSGDIYDISCVVYLMYTCVPA